jgi:hypothetical protein
VRSELERERKKKQWEYVFRMGVWERHFYLASMLSFLGFGLYLIYV